jgi:hypothetical protein
MSFSLEELKALMSGDSGIDWVRSTPDSLMHAPMPENPMNSNGANAAAVDAIRRQLPQRAPEPAIGMCEICGDEAMLLPCTLVAGKPCRHVFCQPCLSQWIATQVGDRQREVRCPAAGCSHPLIKADIVRLSLDSAVPAAHTALLAETYTVRLQEMQADPALKAWMDANARPCPKCAVLITRATGCNAVACTCGHRFCYCCGEERCVNNAPQTSANAFHALLEQQAQLWREELRIEPATIMEQQRQAKKPKPNPMSLAVKMILAATSQNKPVDFTTLVMAEALAAARPHQVQETESDDEEMVSIFGGQ